MSNIKLKKPLTIAMGATFAAAMTASPVASADANPFGMQSMSSGYMQVAEGKCGGAKAKEAKCGEGKCGGKKSSKEGKCGEGKKTMMKEGKCGEGKCGESKKTMMKEGKCGGAKAKEAKCGGKK